MSDVAYFYPPVYQRAPEGSQDSLGPLPGSGGGGSPGQPGKDGASTLTGTGAPPDSLGNDGDVYFALDAQGGAVSFYDKKTAGHWPAQGINLVGAAGTQILGADGPPSEAAVGPEGTLFLDRLNVVIYQARAN